MIIDTATGGPWDWIEELIVAQGCEDSSGLRRALMKTLIEDNYEVFNRWMPVVPENVFNTLRDKIRSYDGTN